MGCRTLTGALVLGVAAFAASAPAQSISAREAACAPRLAAPLPSDGPGSGRQLLGGPGPEQRQLFRNGDAVLLAVGAADGVAVGTQFFTRHRVAPVRVELRRLGLAVEVTTGWVRAVEVGETTTIGVVEHTCRELRRGDLLAPLEWPADVTPEPPGQPDFDEPAQVLFGADGRAMAGAGQFVVIDDGEASGLSPGDRMTVFRPSPGGPDQPVTVVGEGVVVLVADQSATLQLLEASRPVRTGDAVGRHR